MFDKPTVSKECIFKKYLTYNKICDIIILQLQKTFHEVNKRLGVRYLVFFFANHQNVLQLSK